MEWARAHLGLRKVEVTADTVLQVVMLALIAALVFSHLSHHGLGGGVLLLFFWAMNVFTLGHMLTLMIATQYPSHRNLALRLLEPLGAPEDREAAFMNVPAAEDGDRSGVALAFEDVSVRAAGHTILAGIDLKIGAGEQVAIVGRSGAGKSSLLGLLLGWHRPAEGRVLVDGEALDGARLAALRQETAWVDPAVQLWNRSFLDNLRYGSRDGLDQPLDGVVRQADLAGVAAQAAAGAADGARRRRRPGLGRRGAAGAPRAGSAAAGRPPGAPRRALPRPRPGAPARAAEERPPSLAGRTLLCVTHDVGETLGFERVLVLEDGRIEEDGRPEGPGSQAGIALPRPARRGRGGAAGPVGERLLETVADGGGKSGGAGMKDGGPLTGLLWPADRLGEALHALARESGLEPKAEPSSGPADPGDPEALGAWIEAAAAGAGLEAEPVETSYAEIEALLGRAAPAFLRLPGEESSQFLALALSGRRRATLLGPDDRLHRVPAATIRAALCREARRPDRSGGGRPAGARRGAAPPPRSGRGGPVARALRQDPGRRLLASWACRPGAASDASSAAPAWAGWRAAWWAPTRCSTYCFCRPGGCSARGCSKAGSIPGWLLAWALLLLTVAPFRALELWSAGLLRPGARAA